MNDLELKEKMAYIDDMLMRAARSRQEMLLAPWQLAFGGFAAGAAFAAALLALVKILGH